MIPSFASPKCVRCIALDVKVSSVRHLHLAHGTDVRKQQRLNPRAHASLFLSTTSSSHAFRGLVGREDEGVEGL
jgi:hypothetical protein